METITEKRMLVAAVDEVAAAMKEKLLKKHNEGMTGWDNPENREMFKRRLMYLTIQHVFDGGQEIDIMNLAMFLRRMK